MKILNNLNFNNIISKASKPCFKALKPELQQDTICFSSDLERQKIKEYNEKIRQKSSKVCLDRNPLWDCNIPYQENHYYRMIGDLGYEDFLKTGLIRAKQDTKQNYDVAYFEKGRANAIYARNGGANYIVETNSNKITKGSASYPYAKELTKDDFIRIWKRVDNKEYKIIYDTINDVLSE